MSDHVTDVPEMVPATPKPALERLLEMVDVLPKHDDSCSSNIKGADESDCDCLNTDVIAAADAVREEMEALGPFCINLPELFKKERQQAAREALRPIAECGVDILWTLNTAAERADRDDDQPLASRLRLLASVMPVDPPPGA